jgi:hypothetical protein
MIIPNEKERLQENDFTAQDAAPTSIWIAALFTSAPSPTVPSHGPRIHFPAA